MDAVLVGDIGEVAAVVGQLGRVHVPGHGAQLDRIALAGAVVAKGPELAGGAAHRLVGDVVHPLAAGRIPEAAERGLAPVDREHAQAAGGHLHLTRIRLVGRDVLHHQQTAAVRREVLRTPAAAFLQQQARPVAAQVAQPDVAVGAVARGAAVGHLRAVAAEHGAAVLAALAVGEQGGLARLRVEPVQLRELVAAAILAEHETLVRRPRRRHGHAGDGLRIESELLAHAQGFADAVHLAGFGEAGGDEQTAVAGPATDPGTARVLVAVEAFDELGRDLGDVLGDAVALLLAFDDGGSDGLGGRGQGQRQAKANGKGMGQAGERRDQAHGWLPERGWPQARADWRTAPRLRAGRVARAPAPAIGKGGAGAWASLQAFLLPPRPVQEAVAARSGYRRACSSSRSSALSASSSPGPRCLSCSSSTRCCRVWRSSWAMASWNSSCQVLLSPGRDWLASFCSAAPSSRPSKCSSRAPVVMSGRMLTTAISSVNSSTPGWRRATKRYGGCSSSASEGCCSSRPMAPRTRLRRGGANGRLPR